jgi:predicted permease
MPRMLYPSIVLVLNLVPVAAVLLLYLEIDFGLSNNESVIGAVFLFFGGMCAGIASSAVYASLRFWRKKYQRDAVGLVGVVMSVVYVGILAMAFLGAKW